MKKYALYVWLMVSACTLMPANAQDYVVTSVAEQGSTYLETEKNVYFGTDASERLVAVKANVDFSVVSDADWCQVEKAEKAVRITVTANTDAADRTAKVSLKGKDALSYLQNTKQKASKPKFQGFWSCWADLNRRPHPYQGCALPTELQQHICPLK